MALRSFFDDHAAGKDKISASVAEDLPDVGHPGVGSVRSGLLKLW